MPLSIEVIKQRLAKSKSLIATGNAAGGQTIAITLLAEPNLPAGILVELGSILNVNHVDAAIRAYERAIDLEPNNATALTWLAGALDRTANVNNRTQIFQRMLELLDSALDSDPMYIDAVINKAAVLHRLNRTREARELCEAHYDRGKDRLNFLNNYGSTLQSEGCYLEAIEEFKKVIAISSQYANPWCNWGACLQALGRYDEAEENYDKAIALEPNHIESRAGRGFLYLLKGRFNEGWSDFEFRKKSALFTGRIIGDRPLTRPAKVAGKRILLHSEQGVGDIFQFVRYAAVLKEQGASHVMVECPDGLKDLIETCPGIDEVCERTELDRGSKQVVVHAQTNLMTVPYALGHKSLDDIPTQVPYLHAPQRKQARWKQRVDDLTPAGTRIRAGIVWAGNPNVRGDFLRRTTLAHFGRLSRVNGLVCFSMQKGEVGEQQLNDPPNGLRIVPIGHELKTFGDTAALMDNLDVVISVDTGTAHLAGAMGLPVWTLLAESADWRWMLDRDDSPWYPTMRLFRQRILREWDEVFEEVASELERFAADPVLWQINSAMRKRDNGHPNLALVELTATARRHPTDPRINDAIAGFNQSVDRHLAAAA